MPEPGQAVRLIFFVELNAYSFESASHFYSFDVRCVRTKNAHSQFDKFNHVKYTKSLLLRNWYAHIHFIFFVANAPNAHKASSNMRLARRWREDFLASQARCIAIFFAPLVPSSPTFFASHKYASPRQNCARRRAPNAAPSAFLTSL